jgi:hypothetical protein
MPTEQQASSGQDNCHSNAIHGVLRSLLVPSEKH